MQPREMRAPRMPRWLFSSQKEAQSYIKLGIYISAIARDEVRKNQQKYYVRRAIQSLVHAEFLDEEPE